MFKCNHHEQAHNLESDTKQFREERKKMNEEEVTKY